MKKLLFGLLVTLPIAFATPASAVPGSVQDIAGMKFASDVIEIKKGGHGRGHGWKRSGGNRAYGWGRGGGPRAYGWSPGRKVGWRGRGCPPGHAKKGWC